jgi:hypothetical protein
MCPFADVYGIEAPFRSILRACRDELFVQLKLVAWYLRLLWCDHRLNPSLAKLLRECRVGNRSEHVKAPPCAPPIDTATALFDWRLVAEELPFALGRLSAVSVHAPETEELLSQCIYYGDNPVRRAGAIAIYAVEENRLLGASQHGLLIGLIGLCPKGDSLEIRHLAVLANRRQGIGRMLIDQVQALARRATLVAETDRDTIGCCKKCGFKWRSLGKEYADTERFERILESAPDGRV